MAKVMFLVCFPDFDKEEEKRHDNKILTDQGHVDNNVEDEREDGAANKILETKNQRKVDDGSVIESENKGQQHDDGASVDKPEVDSTDDAPAIENDTENVSADPDEKNISEAKKEAPEFVRLISQELSLLEKIKLTLDTLNVIGIQWSLTDDHMHVGMFITDYGSQCELIIKRLSMLKIGSIKNSSISVFPASICIEEDHEEDVEMPDESDKNLKEKVSEFRKSIKSRLVVDQVVTSVQEDAVFTFDFLMLVILASFVAVMGLLEASSVVLVASMLISPLMGPILAAVFGTVIQKSDLILVGVSSELKGLGICILVGFIIGFIPACLEAGNCDWRSALEWPTIEMSSRGAMRSLPVGILIAIPSGAGVALSILGGKIGSLVGVAISASLLPPAVNAGLLWANAILVSISPPQEENIHSMNRVSNSSLTDNGCSPLLHNDYIPLYYCNMALENLVLGFVSLSLTILNIVCIILMGILVLKLKEVAPLFHKSTGDSEKDFFCKDLRIARESYATTKGKSAAAMREQWLKEYRNLTTQDRNNGKEEDDDNDDDDDDDFEDAEEGLNNVIEYVQDSPAVTKIVDRMPVRSRIALSAVSTPRASGHFIFGTPPEYDKGFELQVVNRKSKLSPLSPSPQPSEAYAVYYTVHKFIHPRSLVMSNPSSSWKKGKFLKKLTLPQESRFMVAKVEDPPEIRRKLSTFPEEACQTAGEKKETEPLLTTKA